MKKPVADEAEYGGGVESALRQAGHLDKSVVGTENQCESIQKEQAFFSHMVKIFC